MGAPGFPVVTIRLLADAAGSPRNFLCLILDSLTDMAARLTPIFSANLLIAPYWACSALVIASHSHTARPTFIDGVLVFMGALGGSGGRTVIKPEAHSFCIHGVDGIRSL